MQSANQINIINLSKIIFSKCTVLSSLPKFLWFAIIRKINICQGRYAQNSEMFNQVICGLCTACIYLECLVLLLAGTIPSIIVLYKYILYIYISIYYASSLNLQVCKTWQVLRFLNFTRDSLTSGNGNDNWSISINHE